MFVIKRNGSREEINVKKIRSKIQYFVDYIYTLSKVNVDLITVQVELGLHDNVSTSELDVYTARRCMEMETSEPEYGVLASRILVNNHHKNTLTSFKDKMEKLYRRVDDSGKSHPFLNSTFYKFVCTNQRRIESMIDYQRDYLLDTFGFCTLEQQYINKINGKFVERPQDLFMKEAITLCMNTDDFKDEKALNEIGLLYDLLSTKKFTYATPTLNNSGMITQQLSSCFLLGTEDSLEGINKTLDDAAKISKYGGGIGIHVSNLRSAGQLIRGTNGKSSGIINFLRMYGTGADAYNQGGKRKGSFAIFLRDYHPDFLEFIQLKNPIGDETQRARSLFFCAALSDMFWRAVESDSMWYFVDPEEYKGIDELYGEEFEKVLTTLVSLKKFKKQMKARDVLREIMKQQFESGVPYIINIDAINRKNNLKHYSSIRSSNLCVSGETEILTDKGHIQIRDIVEKELDVKVWNGEEFKSAVFAKTNTNQELLQITTSDGEFMKCTPYHKFYIQRGYGKKEIQVQAKNLKVGDNLIKVSYPVIEMDGDWKYPYAHGFFCGDGTYDHPDNIETPCTSPPAPGCAYCAYHSKQGDIPDGEYKVCQGLSNPKNPKVSLYGAKKSLVGEMPVRSSKNIITPDATQDKITIPLSLDMPPKFSVPERATIDIRLAWLAGYIDADGTMARNGKNETIQITSGNLSFLRRVKRLCQTLGTNPMISLMKAQRESLLPDGKGGNKLYECKEVYRLLFNSNDTYALYQLGLSTKRLQYHRNKPQRSASRFITIKSISILDEKEDTYCFNEPDTHRGIFNGIIAGNCVEITLPSSSTEYGVCNLASLVLSSFVTDNPSNGDIEMLRQPCYQRKVMTNPVFDFMGLSRVVQILTRTMDRVIDRNAYPVKEAMLSNILHRPVGIGCSGLADTCCLLRVPYDSDEGVKLSGFIAETIAFSAYSESSAMAKALRGKKTVEQQQALTQEIFDIYDRSKKYKEMTTMMDKLSRTIDVDQKEYNSLRDERNKYCENPCIDIIPLAKQLGVYPSYYYGDGAPISRGEFQWKMWGLDESKLSGMWDWSTLEEHIKRFGIRNSLLTAQMPTATTAQIMSVNEGIEPFTTNMYRRAVLSGEFVVFNKYLIHDLIGLGLWNDNMKNYLIASGGSIQHIDGIPQELKNLYKTAWDMGQKIGVKHAVARGPFLDHSQSFNVFIGNSTDESKRADKLYKTLHYGWKNGLKTGIYYLRTQPAIQAQQFSIPLESLAKVGEMRKFTLSSLPSVSEEQGCLLCGT